MLGVQTWRLETSPLDVIGTTFGTTWLIRMIITIIIIGIWFWMEKRKEISIKGQIPLLVASLILIATTTMMGHGASTELEAAWILDYSHNLLSSIWIGGVIFLHLLHYQQLQKPMIQFEKENYTKFDSKIFRIIHHCNWNFNHHRSNVTMVLR